MSDLWPWKPAPTEKPKSSLDDRLREIIISIMPDIDDETTAVMLDKVMAQLKQAFIDEHWIERKKITREFRVDEPRYPLMTGQEWYDRFEKEVDSFDETDISFDVKVLLKSGMSEREAAAVVCTTRLFEAAKRAAGLE